MYHWHRFHQSFLKIRVQQNSEYNVQREAKIFKNSSHNVIILYYD